MPPNLRPISRFIVEKQHRLLTSGHLCAVRLVREGDRLDGAALEDPAVGFFDAHGQLVRRMSIEEFETEFSSDLEDHRHADPALPASATIPLEPATLFGALTLSPRHA